MAQIFDVMTLADTVKLDEQGRATITFTVHNPGSVNRTAEFTILTTGNTQASWFTFSLSEIIPAQGQRTLEVKVEVPISQRKAKHEIRLQAVDQADPRGDHVQSKGITITGGVSKFPWWLVVVASVVIIAGVVAVIAIAGRDKKVVVPNLLGLPIMQAQRITQQAGLSVNVIEEIEQHDQNAGTVLSQEPTVGTKISPKTAIEVTIAKAAAIPSPVSSPLVPDLKGKHIDEARQIAEVLGFTLEVSPFSTLVRETPGTVKTQIPDFLPGLSLPSGSAIKVTIVKEWIEAPSIVSLSISEAMQLLNPQGFILDIENAKLGEGITEVKLTSKISGQSPTAGTLYEKQSGATHKIIPHIGTGRWMPIDRGVFERFKRNINFLHDNRFIIPGGGN